MTINISLRFVLFVLYTAALLVGAFGISYAVFEWRDDSPDKVAVNERLDGLDDRIGKLTTKVGAVSGHSHDDCGDKIIVFVVDQTIFLDTFASLTESERNARGDRLIQDQIEMQEACR